MVDALKAIETVRAELERAEKELQRLTKERKEAVAQYEELLNSSRLVEQKLDRIERAATALCDSYDARLSPSGLCAVYSDGPSKDSGPVWTNMIKALRGES